LIYHGLLVPCSNQDFDQGLFSLSACECAVFSIRLKASSAFVPTHSMYKERFWENLAAYDITPINPGLAAQLGKTLKLVE